MRLSLLKKPVLCACALILVMAIPGCLPVATDALLTMDANQPLDLLYSAQPAAPEPNYILGLIPLPQDQYNSIPLATLPAMGELPDQVDMRKYLPPVGDQGAQGSCVGWAVAYALKTYQESAERGWDASETDHQFSPAFLYNHIKHGNCNSGAFMTDALTFLSEQGCCTLKSMPYNDSRCEDAPSQAAVDEARQYRVSSWRRVNVQDTNELCTHLAAGYPIVIAMKVYTNFLDFRNRSIYDRIDGVLEGYHALCVVGYDRKNGNFLVINSWSDQWGDAGYFRIPFALFRAIVMEAYVVQDIVENRCKLSIQTQGEGLVMTDPPGENFLKGTQVQLTAYELPGWHFVGWQGDLTGSANPVTLTMSAAKSVQAVFALEDENDPPIIDEAALSPALTQDQPTTITLSCRARDPGGMVASVTANLAPIGGSSSQSLTSQGDDRWSWTGNITPLTQGQVIITLQALDNNGAQSSFTLSKTVAPADATPPIIENPTISGRLHRGCPGEITVTCRATDADCAIQSVRADFSSLGGPAAKSLTRGTNDQWQWTGTLTPTIAGDKCITLLAINEKGTSAEATVTLHVNSPPIITSPRINVPSAANSKTPITVSCIVTDVDGQIRSVQADLSALGGPASQDLVRGERDAWEWTGYMDNPQANAAVTVIAVDDEDASTRVSVSINPDLAAVVAGDEHTLVLQGDGTVWTFGRNLRGQLGDATSEYRNTPGPIPNLTSIQFLAAGSLHNLAVRGDSTVWGWGNNYTSQLGNGKNIDTSIPVQAWPIRDVKFLAAGTLHSLALKTDGTVWSWGHNYDGQLGNGTTTGAKTPSPVANLTSITALAAGAFHNLALKSNGTVWTWGRNTNGQLGDGRNEKRLAPFQVLSDVTAIATGTSHSLVLRTDGTVCAWGANGRGQLGDASTADRNVPVQVAGLSSIIAIAAGGDHNLALKSDGTLWAWGANDRGQLGDGSNADRNQPVQITGPENIRRIACGGHHSLALGDYLWAWGGNDYGQLGDGTTLQRNTPILIPWPGD